METQTRIKKKRLFLWGMLRGELMSVGDVQLEKIDATNWRETLEIRAGAGQLKFVAGYEPVALVMLSKSYLGLGGLNWEPFGIRYRAAMVGIVALAHAGSTCEIVHLLIDRSRQREGFGKATLQAIVRHVISEMPRVNELKLTAHPRNEPAHALYRSAGFGATGEHRDREPIWKLKLEG